MMKKAIRGIVYGILFGSVTLCVMSLADDKKVTVNIDKVGKTVTLPRHYPEQWVFAHDGAFMHMINGHYMLLDPAAATGAEQYKGMVDASFLSSFAQSKSRNEFYVIETFYSRGSRGNRTDVVNSCSDINGNKIRRNI